MIRVIKNHIVDTKTSQNMELFKTYKAPCSRYVSFPLYQCVAHSRPCVTELKAAPC